MPLADKYCGDAVCTPAINILEDMGVLKELMDNNEAHFADAGAHLASAVVRTLCAVLSDTSEPSDWSISCKCCASVFVRANLLSHCLP